jgi:hypothetical protein
MGPSVVGETKMIFRLAQANDIKQLIKMRRDPLPINLKRVEKILLMRWFPFLGRNLTLDLVIQLRNEAVNEKE